MNYESVVEIASTLQPGVKYDIAKISFGRRLELIRQLRELAPKIEFLTAAGEERDDIDAALLTADIDRLYLRWGLIAIRGLLIDSEPATPQTLAEIGPEDLFQEALASIKAACHLSEAERKN
jgi:hypothetical protein